MANNSSQETGMENQPHWFVKYVLAEIPIIGSFFIAKSLPQALNQAGKSTAMLVGATTGMILNVVSSETETDSMALRMTKMTANMAVGMAGGNIIYNGLSNGGEILYRYCVHRNSVPPIQSEAEQVELLDRALAKSDLKTSKAQT